MKFVNRFEKIQIVREQEKVEAITHYEHSMKQFEKVAEELYELLKKKETLQADQEQKLLVGYSVQEMRQQQLFLQHLDKSIEFYQKEVVKARQKMNWNAEKVKEKNMEVKKVECLVDKGFAAFTQNQAALEAKEMDEISTQFFANRALK
ncbi:flagellar export protein FliJ [Mangrovibacillus cuniculi]|uniref:Flagellar FliJ protein n=1 Tax=Mangrovibacillus cuniculi TaxID=2593652 RepID=A0A7S8CAD8_9BACI|nr:flagellar export protein FliJ [Mangrovibacillus cuniculi]QPC46345.1 flagellar export protein FliJ [Mangrovibacillus cuniculi]